MTWSRKLYVEERTLKVFEVDNTDGTREDDLYGLIGLRFQPTEGEAKRAKHKTYRWYHPDKCQQRAEQERIVLRVRITGTRNPKETKLRRTSVGCSMNLPLLKIRCFVVSGIFT